MNPASANSRARQQRELDREQSLVDVDQSIAEREQARADGEQHRLDQAQLSLDADAPPGDPDDSAALVGVSQRQAELGLAQDRSDAHQTQLDDSQRAHDIRRHVLDGQQAPLDQAAATDRSFGTALPAAAEERDRALHLRAIAALARAEQAHRRAEEALRRVEAYDRRKNDRGPGAPGSTPAA
jgi:hypothetical protein